MIRNYLKTALRNLWKNKSYSFINILGLAVGLAAVFLIALWIQHQFRYDNFYSHQDDLYKVRLKTTGADNEIYVGDITSAPIAPYFEQEYPEVESAARMYWSSDALLAFKDKSVKSQGNEVDPSFLNIFNFPVLHGAGADALAGKHHIVLTKSLAKSLFGSEDPIDKVIVLDNDQPYTVTAVLEDLPSYTDFNFSYLIPLSNTDAYGASWRTNTYYTFVRLKSGTDVQAFNKKIEDLIAKNSKESARSQAFLYSMEKQYLYTRFEQGKAVGGKIDEVRLVAIIGVLILAIAAINFVNLSTARGQKRAKEVGVRKVIGASRSTLVKQFLLESVLLSTLAGLIALLLVCVMPPLFGWLLPFDVRFEAGNLIIWLTFVAFTVLTGVLAGLYPAFFLSSFAVSKTLKGGTLSKKAGFSFREVLVVLQFCIAIVLIISTIVIRTQIQHTQDRNIGYEKAQLLEIPLEGEAPSHYEAIRSALLQDRSIVSVARTGWSITIDGSSAGGNFSWEGATPEQTTNTFFRLYRAEDNLVKTLGLNLIDGRDLDYIRLPADSASVLLNQAAIQAMGLKNPVGQSIKWGDKTYTVVGVIDDFIIGSPYEKVRPMLIYTAQHYMSNMLVKINAQAGVKNSLTTIENVLKKFNPAYPFDFKFVDQRFAAKFNDQQQTGQLTFIFSALAIAISCLGLFGLIAFIAETRIKEIGIRKVLGASVPGIVMMLSKDFVKLVLLALVIAAPIAWWAMNNWLADFTYRIDLVWWMFAWAGLAAVLITVLTVSGQALRAAMANPVDSLRNE